MDETGKVLDYIELLRSDLVEQFRGKPALDVLVQAIGRQLNDVYRFFIQLRDERGLLTAKGKQLDGIGDVAVLDRAAAGELACVSEPTFVIDDEVYRDLLIYKIWRNTNTTTYYDIIKSLRIFWDRPIYYREDPELPAFMIFDTGEMPGLVDTRRLMVNPIIRAAGVGYRLEAITSTVMEPSIVTVRSGFLRWVEDQLPFIDRDINFDVSVHGLTGWPTVTETEMPATDRLNRAGQTSIMETPIGGITFE